VFLTVKRSGLGSAKGVGGPTNEKRSVFEVVGGGGRRSGVQMACGGAAWGGGAAGGPVRVGEEGGVVVWVGGESRGRGGGG